jgi:hypothetical protein
MRLEVARGRVIGRKDVINIVRADTSLLRRKSEGCLEKIEEGGLARRPGADYENAIDCQFGSISRGQLRKLT